VESKQSRVEGRYEVREREQGSFLYCREAPGIAVAVHKSHSYSETDARKLGKRVILLDGAGQFGPLVDATNQVYNLDHHEGCVRALTLATCEQAMVLVAKGLELDKGDWTVYANEPDLDTVLAIWVLLNHRRLSSLSPGAHDTLMPLLRLEGSIDANGHALTPFCGLPEAALRSASASVEHLMSRLNALADSSRRQAPDLVELTLRMMCEVDALVFTDEEIGEVPALEEMFGHVSIGGDRVAVACHDPHGIYAVEGALKKIWGDRLGIIVLQEGKSYTLRRSAAFSGIDLQIAYERLNLIDRTVDGSPPSDRWGGSEDIGGSPRIKGSKLQPDEVLEALAVVYRGRRWPRLIDTAGASFWTLVALAAAGVIALGASLALEDQLPEAQRSAASFAAFCVALALAAAAGAFSTRRPWIFGLRLPRGLDWLVAVPVVAAAALAGGIWMPLAADAGPAATWPARIALGVLAAFAAELWFRGVAHGYQLFGSHVPRVAGPWRISRPTAVSALLYAGTSYGLSRLWLAPPPLLAALPGPPGSAVLVGAAFAAGIALAVVRERSMSVWPCVLLHVAAQGITLLPLPALS
jgi:hypothetical protein